MGEREWGRREGAYEADGLAELLALEGVGDGEVEGALGESDHLSGDSDSAWCSKKKKKKEGVQCDFSACLVLEKTHPR